MTSDYVLPSRDSNEDFPDTDWQTGRFAVVNADDFGRSYGINRGIIRAFEEGIVTSASLMVRWTSAQEAAAYARNNPSLGVGLHFDLSEWAYRDEEWHKNYEFASVDDSEGTQNELARQIDIFRKLMGKEPTHLDSHQHVHRGKASSAALLALAEELEIPVRHYSPGVAYCGDFYGQDSRGASLPDYISSDALIGILSILPPGITEVVCHPGEEDACELMYGSERVREMEALCNPAVREAATASGIRFCSFADVPYSLKITTPLYNRAVSLWQSGQKAAAADLLRRELITLTPAAAQIAAQIYLEVDAPLEAWHLIEPLDDRFVRQSLIVQIARALRTSGHLAAGRKAIERACARAPGDLKTQAVRDLIGGEEHVLLGRWKAPTMRVGSLVPIPGRVLHVVGKSLPQTQAGYTIRTHCVARAQRHAGLDPCVVTQLGFPWTHGVSEASMCEDVDGILYHRLPALNDLSGSLSERLSENAKLLALLVQRLRPAVLHAASDYLNALLALAVGREFGLPVVYEVRGFWEETWLTKRPLEASSHDAYQWRRERELQCMLAADHVVTLAEIMKRQLVERGVPEEKITLVPNAVDTDAFRPVPRDEALAKRLGIGANEVVAGYISSFSAYEGIAYLIDALAILRRRGLPVHVVLVGDGEERERLESQVAALGMMDHVTFTGRIPYTDVLRYYGLIDIFVVPRTADRVSQLVTPLKPYEAMASGRAVVVSNVDALKELVQDGVTGVTFEPENSEDLASVLQCLMKQPAERKRLGETALAWVREHRTWARNGLLYRDLYKRLGADSQ